MVRFGIAGVGFMGMIHYLAAGRSDAASVSALASRDPLKRAGDWRKIKGNFGPTGVVVDLHDVTTYEATEELLADPEVDVVDLCVPTPLHAELAVAAMEAGKHVLIEKPISLRLEDADRILEASRRTGRLAFVGHVLPFFQDFEHAYRAIDSGRLGRPLAASFRRHISPPDWSADIAGADTTGGPIIDLHIHDAHFVALGFGMPRSVSCVGLSRSQGVCYVQTTYVYDDPAAPVVTASSGAISAPSRPFAHGLEIYFEDGLLYAESGQPFVEYGAEDGERPDLASSDPIDAFAAELDAVAKAVTSEGRELDARLDAALARDALALCLAERESVLTGRPVSLDG